MHTNDATKSRRRKQGVSGDGAERMVLGRDGSRCWLHTADYLDGVECVASVLTFSLYIAYDTMQLIREHASGKRNAIGHAAAFSMDAISLFVDVLRALYRMRRGRVAN